MLHFKHTNRKHKMSAATYSPGPWTIYPVLSNTLVNRKVIGFVVLCGTRGEALDRNGCTQYDGTRRDCFFATEAAARAAIATTGQTTAETVQC